MAGSLTLTGTVVGATIRIDQEIQCLQYTGFLKNNLGFVVHILDFLFFRMDFFYGKPKEEKYFQLKSIFGPFSGASQMCWTSPQ